MTDRSRSDRPFDPGLQVERTALAWRRTALAIGVGSLLAVRILPELLGVWGILPAAVGLALAGVVFVAAHRRFRTHHVSLTGADTDRIALPDGTLPALVAATTLGGGLVSLAVVLTR